MTTLRPKLVIRGADEAIAFYARVFEATLVSRYTLGDRVVHSELTLLGGTIIVKDEDDADPSPQALGRPGVLMDVITDTPDQLAAAVVEAGGTAMFPATDQPYGARGGRVRDPFGHEWLLQTPVSLTPDEVQAAMDAMR